MIKFSYVNKYTAGLGFFSPFKSFTYVIVKIVIPWFNMSSLLSRLQWGSVLEVSNYSIR